MNNNIKENYRSKQIIKNESYQDYLNKIEHLKNTNDNWIYNILDGYEEKDNILYSDDKFIILLPTIHDEKKLHLLAFVRDINIRSLRDLNNSHISLLEHIYEKTTIFIESNYGINKNKLKVYIHYHPSTWVLHIHFNLIENTDGASSVEYSHSLYNILNILKMKSDYYQTIVMDVLY